MNVAQAYEQNELKQHRQAPSCAHQSSQDSSGLASVPHSPSCTMFLTFAALQQPSAGSKRQGQAFPCPKINEMRQLVSQNHCSLRSSRILSARRWMQAEARSSRCAAHCGSKAGQQIGRPPASPHMPEEDSANAGCYKEAAAALLATCNLDGGETHSQASTTQHHTWAS
eukprot:1160819-Pelagomonas_calceolata.AAC.6